MVFSRGNTKEKNEFIINDKTINYTKQIKYLGISINKNGNFTPTLEDLSRKATKAIFAIHSKINLKFLPIKILMKLFDSMIGPILLYGSEIWEPFLNQNEEKWDANAIEKVHTQFIKRILGVNRSTMNILVRGEMGRYSLQSNVLLRNIKYLKYLQNKDNNYLAKQAYLYELSKTTNRSTIASSMVKARTKLHNLIDEDVDLLKISDKKLRGFINLIHSAEWKTKLQSSSKAETYNFFKNEIKFEKYLNNIKNKKHLIAFNKFRLSDHKLMIEEGRRLRPQKPRNERTCKICDIVEDEIHFLIECKMFEDQRKILFDNICTKFPNFTRIIDNKAKFIFLLSQEDEHVTKMIASNIFTWNQINEEKLSMI